jgi:hypothetical protein
MGPSLWHSHDGAWRGRASLPVRGQHPGRQIAAGLLTVTGRGAIAILLGIFGVCIAVEGYWGAVTTDMSAMRRVRFAGGPTLAAQTHEWAVYAADLCLLDDVVRGQRVPRATVV